MTRSAKRIAYCREYYRQHREEWNEKRRQQRREKKQQREGQQQRIRTVTLRDLPEECCNFCRHFSGCKLRGDYPESSYKRKHDVTLTGGWCMKRRRHVPNDDVCGDYRPDEDTFFDYPVRPVTIFA